jgi:hypothetical protein
MCSLGYTKTTLLLTMTPAVQNGVLNNRIDCGMNFRKTVQILESSEFTSF